MRTSRIAKDTAALVEALSPRKTRSRSALASPTSSRTTTTTTSRSAASTSKGRRGVLAATNVKVEDADASPPLNGTVSGVDIEDGPFEPSTLSRSSRKRKRIGTGTATDLELATAAAAAAVGASPAPQRHNQRRSSERPIPKQDTRIESEPEQVKSETETGLGPLKAPKSTPVRKIKDRTSGAVMIHPPARWELQWDACQTMRKRIIAPVDTVGCDRLHDASAPPRDQRFQTLFALMLSPQTKDGVTAAAMERIRHALGPGRFNASGILETDEDTLDALINPVGFHRTKARHIRAASLMLKEKHASDVPQDIDQLMALPGVGPKIAYLCLAAAWGKTLGIGVDTHVHRITNRWGWHRTGNAEETRKTLEEWLPKEKWAAINHMLVGFGQTVCAPIGPRCDECVLAEQKICPAAVRTKSPKKGRSVLLEWKVKEEEEKEVNGGNGVVQKLDGRALARV